MSNLVQEQPAGTQTTVGRAPRDLRIDFLRGFFILHLCATHFTWFADLVGYDSPLKFYGLPSFGLSSPAEFFVFFSGYVMVLVLGRSFDKAGFLLTQARAIDRAWSLYVLNLFTFVIVAAGSGFLFDPDTRLFVASGMGRLLADPSRFILDFVTFRDNLAFFEILRNYIFFIPLIALFLLLARVKPWLPIVLSGLVWLAHQLGVTARLDYPTFNPFGWQFLFFLGGTVALMKPLTTWTFPRPVRQLALCLAFLAFILLMKLVLFPGVQSENVPFASKTDVGPLRVLHFGLVLYTAMLLVPASAWLQRFMLTRAIIGVGQTSLECFCLSSVLVYLGAHLLGHAPQSAALYWGLLVGMLVIELLAGRLFGWFKQEPWRVR